MQSCLQLRLATYHQPDEKPGVAGEMWHEAMHVAQEDTFMSRTDIKPSDLAHRHIPDTAATYECKTRKSDTNRDAVSQNSHITFPPLALAAGLTTSRSSSCNVFVSVRLHHVDQMLANTSLSSPFANFLLR